MRHRSTILLIMLSLMPLATAHAKGIHVVSEGDTLWKISRTYGCNIQLVRDENGLNDSSLQVGQQLEVSRCKSKVAPATRGKSSPKDQGVIRYTVRRGDTLGTIAARYGTSVRKIQQRNQIRNSAIFPGDFLELTPTKAPPLPHPKVVLGQSHGHTNAGHLRRPTRLAKGKGYYIRRAHRSYGAEHTVAYTKRMIRSVRRQFPKVHTLAIGDISAVNGGKITRHASHQSGRDIDIGFYFRRKPSGYPSSFVVATMKNLHFGATWKMLREFVDLANRPLGVEKIFMSYSTQRILYKMAKKRGIPERQLRAMFQYPRGRFASEGFIRHEPGHDEHIHVRFKCPPRDTGCK